MECRQKAYNWHEKRLVSFREADALMTGEAFHAGVAHLFASGNNVEAVQMAETTYRNRIAKQEMILPEERVILEQAILFTRRAVERYGEHYAKEPFQVIWPEVAFSVPLPNTHHHCWFMHRIVHPDVPFDQCVARDYGQHGLDVPPEPLKCWQPIWFHGRTDGVINWQNLIWLLEHKTTAMTGDIFYDRFYLDFQPTGYLYGIWKQTGTRPHGFVLNVVKKPNKRASDQLAVGFEREAYSRNDDDLLRFERELILLAQDYEAAFSQKRIYMNTKSCTNYNRRCYYWDLCKRNDEPSEEEFRLRDMDYVDKQYYKILGLPVPGEPLIQLEGATTHV